MSNTVGIKPTVVDFTTIVAGLLDTIDYDQVVLLTDQNQLDLVTGLLHIQSRMTGLVHTVLGIIDRAGATRTAYGVPTVSWLAAELRYTRPQATSMLHHAGDLHRFSHLADALRTGVINDRQAATVTRVLRTLPADLDPAAEQAAETTMVGYCDQFDSHQLSTLSRHLLDVIAPDIAEQTDARRLDRELRAAERGRHLHFSDDGHGSTLIRASMPTADAALLKAQIDAIAHHLHRTTLDKLDPLVGEVTWPMRRADALTELARTAALHHAAPNHGGDRPHLTILIDYQQLLTDCRHARLADGTELTASQLRHHACDAGVLPIIMGGPSGVLDVGRERRLVTPDIRKALHARDQGCIFPGCNRPATDCDAHHITPWHHHGPTALPNLCLLCKHHHNLLEPDPHRTQLQWKIQIATDGIPEVIPPRHVDTHQQPRRHQRFRKPS